MGWFCDMVQNPPMISRDAGSAIRRPRCKHESTAYHEAGHAVPLFVLRLKVRQARREHRAGHQKDLVGVAHEPDFNCENMADACKPS